MDWDCLMQRLRSALLACALIFPVHAFAQDPAAVEEIVARVAERRLLLVGEIHGTAEVPLVLAELTQEMGNSERPLIVGLEIWGSEQDAIDRFLASAGTALDRARLLEGTFWTRAYQDGRSSQAMLDLLERLRALALKADIEVLAFDQQPATGGDDAARDRAMAARIAAALDARPTAQALVLAGNFHTRVQDGAPWDPTHRFMGHHLIDYQPYSIEIMGVAGSAWICTSAELDSCKARVMPENALKPGLLLGDEIGERGHHGIWWLPAVTASAPATAAPTETFP
jgi:hypothetical protein